MNEATVGDVRALVLRSVADVAHGLLVGSAPRNELPSAQTLLRFAFVAAEPGARDVAIVDPSTGALRGRFASGAIVRSCVAIEGNRVLYLEGASLVSRAIDGSDPRVHVAQVHGDNEMIVGELSHEAGLVTAISRRASEIAAEQEDDYDYGDAFEYDVRVFNLRDGRMVRELARRGYLSLCCVREGALIVSNGGYDESDAVLEAIDLATGARRWSSICAQWFEDRSPYNFGFFASKDAILVVCDGGTAIVEASAGSLRTIVKSAQCVATDGVDIALYARGGQSLEARRISDNVLVARWRTDTRIESAYCIDSGRFACSATRSMHVIDVRDSNAVVSFGIAHSTLDRLAPTLVGGPGWVALAPRGGDLSLSDQPSRERLTALATEEPRQGLVIARPEELSKPAVESDLVAPPVDEARIAAIATVLREEHGDERAAWERLVAQSLVDPALDTDRCIVTITSHPFRIGEGRANERRAEAWLAFAHDQPTIATIADVANELCERIAPWSLGVAPGWRLELDVVRWYGAPSSLRQRWFETIEASVRFEPARRGEAEIVLTYAPLHRVAMELDYLWKRAVEHDLRLPDSAPAPLANKRFADVRSPLEPLLALCAMGSEPKELTDEFVTIPLWGIELETGRRVVPPPDDIPF